ncbi:hypothetical protein BC939DRAFT_446867 [Gamsiella multidivaricata]|uniref:uncharacterized protein n=1 Tax=Gamsiella multidivaricata TaxID=101098 RepID=UPI00222093B2|nr:uncharacterized protein BC939DRAFT_446867 [Gamsiella multidivaricata]KAI7826596.1 hypothetical protein BC939DRAFT_446867 [Gamsiella multidivaricata]
MVTKSRARVPNQEPYCRCRSYWSHCSATREAGIPRCNHQHVPSGCEEPFVCHP